MAGNKLKKSRKSAAEVNRFIDPTLKEETDYVKKNGNRLPKKLRDFSHVVNKVDHILMKEFKDLPRGISPIHFLAMERMSRIAFRENVTSKEVKCPHCKKKHSVEMPHVKAEANTVSALSNYWDRMWPKLGHLTQEVNLIGHMNEISTFIVNIIVEDIPVANRGHVMAKVTQFFERIMNNDSSTQGKLSQTENIEGGMFQSVA